LVVQNEVLGKIVERGFSWACSVELKKFRSKRTVDQADMTLALLGQNLYKYLGII